LLYKTIPARSQTGGGGSSEKRRAADVQPLQLQTRHQLLRAEIQKEFGVRAGEDVLQEVGDVFFVPALFDTVVPALGYGE
jgi:hypothetical protein